MMKKSMMMKKSIGIALLSLCCGAFAACGEVKEQENTVPKEQQENQEEEKEIQEEKENQEESKEEEKEDKEIQKEEKKEEEKEIQEEEKKEEEQESQKEEKKEEEQETAALPDVTAQIQMIAKNVSVWKLEEDPIQAVGYTVTDLDQNGRLEIISSVMGGTGMFSTNKMWEVNETGTELIFCESDRETEGEGYDIMKDRMPVYYDKAENRYYYLVEDIMRNGMASNTTVVGSASLSEGMLHTLPLTVKTEEYDENGEVKITFKDAEENELTEEEYMGITDKHFQGFEKKEAGVDWLIGENFGEMVESVIAEKLEASYYGFVIQ